MTDEYCAHCGSWMYSIDDSDSFTIDEDSMSTSDDWEWNAEEKAEANYRSPFKRTRREAGINDDDGPAARKKRRMMEEEAMDVDDDMTKLYDQFANMSVN